jgi:GntP family permease
LAWLSIDQARAKASQLDAKHIRQRINTGFNTDDADLKAKLSEWEHFYRATRSLAASRREPPQEFMREHRKRIVAGSHDHDAVATTGQFDQAVAASVTIGTGSLFFNYANHAGFWMVKESFGMTMGEATKTISIVQSIVALVGLVMVLLMDLFPRII